MTFPLMLFVLILTNIVYTIGFLGALILTNKQHEHYFLGFDPGLKTFKIRNTKITLGVYIPIIGLSRIYLVNTTEKKEIFYPWQLSNISLFKRLFITYSGVLSLLIFGILMAILATYTSQHEYIGKEEVIKHGIYPSDRARALGFMPGDKVLAVNGQDYSDFYELVQPKLMLSPNTEFTVLRGTQEIQIKMGKPEEIREIFFSLYAPFSVGQIAPNSPAQEAGILVGDKISKVNGQPIVNFLEMNAYLQSDDDGEVVLEIERGEGASQQRFEKLLFLNADRKLGIIIKEEIEYKIREYSLFESITLGAKRYWVTLLGYIKAIKFIVVMNLPGQKQTLSGPISVSSALGNPTISWRLTYIYFYTCFVLILNFLPFPKSALLETIPLAYEALSKKSFAVKSFRLIRNLSIGLLVFILMWQFVGDILRLL